MDCFPEIITFRITSRCNGDCSFCYGPKGVPELSFKKLKKIFVLLAHGGARSIVITGGEPLIGPDIKKILAEANRLGLKIFLDTNADLFFRHTSSINSHVNTLGLPLDNITTKSIIGHPNSDQVIKVLDYYKQLSPKIKKPRLRIGTVVTQENINQLSVLAKLIKDFPVDYWKLYQVVPVSQLASGNLVNDGDFLRAIEKVVSTYGQEIKIIASQRRHRANAYFLINPDGQVIMPGEKNGFYQERAIGNVFDPDIIGKWKSLIHENNYLENAEDTFFHQWNNYPMAAIYNKIWRLARKYNRRGQCYTEKHIEWLVRQSLRLAKQEKVDEQIFIPFILLHDVGYGVIETDSPFKDSSRKNHMRAGKQVAKKILDQVDYPSHLTDKICNYIAIHDNWAFNDHQLYRRNKVLGLFNDLDFISMYSADGFSAMGKILAYEPKRLLDFLDNNEKLINRPFVSDNSQLVYKDSIKKLRMQASSGLL